MNTLVLALWSLWQRRGRAVLAALSLGLGIASVVLGLSIVSGYQREIEKMTFGAYSRALIIRENKTIQDVYGPPTLADGQALKTGLEGIENIIYRHTATVEVRSQRETYFARAIGFSGQFSLETGDRLLWGRLPVTHSQGFDRECTVGYRLASKLKLLKAETRPATIIVNNTPCTLIGILAEPQSRIEETYGFSVLMPLNYLIRYVDSSDEMSVDEVDQITVIFTPGTKLSDKRQKADRILRKTHGIPQSHASGYTYRDENFPLKALKRQRNLIGTIILVLGVLTIAVSALGFGVIWVNMLAARKTELATQLAVGARVSHLLAQLFTEVSIITAFGIGAGLTLSRVLGTAIAKRLDIPIELAQQQMIWISGLSFLVAILIVLQSILAIARMPLSTLVK